MVMRRTIGAVMLLLGAFLLVQAVADSAIGDWLLAGSPPSSMSISDVDRVFITSGSGEVRIYVEDRPDLVASMEGPGADRAAVRMDRRGGELRISAARPWWKWPPWADQTVLEVRLPAVFDGALGVQIRSGALWMSGPAGGGAPVDDRTPSGPLGGPGVHGPTQLRALELELRSGRAELTDVAAGSLSLTVRSGELSAAGVAAGEAVLHQASGSVSLDRYSGPLEAHLSSGNLSVDFASLPGPVWVDQASGRLLLDLPTDAGFELDVRTRSGSFESDLPAAPSTGDVRSGLLATYGGGGPRIQLRANSGAVTLRSHGPAAGQ